MVHENIIALLVCLIIFSVIGLSICVYYYIEENKKDEKDQNKNTIIGLISSISLLSVILLALIILFYNYWKIKQESTNNKNTPLLSPTNYDELNLNTPVTGQKDRFKTPETGDSNKSQELPPNRWKDLKKLTKLTFSDSEDSSGSSP